MPKKKEDRPSKRLSVEPEGWRGSQIDSDSESSDEETPAPAKRTSRFSILSTSKDTTKESSGASAPKRVSGASKDGQRMSISAAPTIVKDGFWERLSRRIARIPRIFLFTTMLISIVLSVVGFTVGGFDAAVDNAGWQSRGTDIANKQTQLLLVNRYRDELFAEGQSRWADLLTNVQPGWQTSSLGDDGTDDGLNRRLSAIEEEESQWYIETSHRELQAATLDLDLAELGERLIAGLPNCDIGWYANVTDLLYEEHLWPIWKTENPSTTLLSPNMLRDICVAEENTQRVLEANDFCFGCQEGCLPPYSPVLFARIVVENGFSMTCEELSEGWTEYQAATENSWAQCTEDLKQVYDSNGFTMPTSCPPGFTAALVEENFDSTKFMTYTSSIFATNADPKVMYDFVDQFDQGVEEVVYGAYDTQYEGFNTIFTDSVVGRDMALACASAFITAIAIVIHTKSPFITVIGLLQIILSFPLSFFVYTLIGGLEFFPFLNFIGVFVVFALGADDIFVAVDKWKNARIEHPDAETDTIAAIAFPDAAGAMFLTTITTAIAFFGTAICPVAPIKMFAIFCGLLIMFDYLMCCMLVFPALCIYDKKLMEGRSNCCNACSCGSRKRDDEEEEEEKISLIHRILFKYYSILHKLRWFLLALSVVGFGLAAWGATTLKLPTTAEVRLVGEDAIQFEQNFLWRDKLLQSSLDKSGGSTILVGFGIDPADTGDHNNPKKWSQLVLDNTFDAAPEASQRYLESFCPELFAEDFASPPYEGYECSFNRFVTWLETESAQASPDAGYASKCGGATGIPVPEANFDACMIEWAAQNEEDTVLSVDDKVRILMMEVGIRIRFDSPFDDLEAEYNTIDNWMTTKSASAPETANKVIFSSQTFWWFDTNRQMLTTATGSASIALATAAIVIFLSSYSFALTFFATFTIGYVLTSVTSTLVAIGWTLGFLESICFAILIGVSVDFVIHFCHAYAHATGEVDRHERTQQALIRMGPSILAAGVTTVAAAIIMLFTVINFFQKFALILFMTIIQATVGSFIVFLTLTDCIGPSNPTYLADLIKSKLGFGKPEDSDDDSNVPTKKRDGTELMTQSSR